MTYRVAMIFRFITLFLLVFLCTLQSVEADWRWAHEYRNACEPQSPDWPICRGYIKGFLGAVEMQVSNTNTPKAFCLPQGLATEEAARIFRDFINLGSFEVLAMEGALYMALSVKFPCRAS
jgi:hypothetical protein